MHTPVKMTIAEFAESRRAWVAEHCVLHGNLQLCKTCGAEIALVFAFLSMHDARFSICSGYGVCWRIAIPYCPNCEPRPRESGCLHETPCPAPWHRPNTIEERKV
jgi:hypothetical protein